MSTDSGSILGKIRHSIMGMPLKDGKLSPPLESEYIRCLKEWGWVFLNYQLVFFGMLYKEFLESFKEKYPGLPLF